VSAAKVLISGVTGRVGQHFGCHFLTEQGKTALCPLAPVRFHRERLSPQWEGPTHDCGRRRVGRKVGQILKWN
ncbi:MAG: hypothetical protein ACPG4M_10055, partial [Alphaproteobacteria bacterium]